MSTIDMTAILQGMVLLENSITPPAGQPQPIATEAPPSGTLNALAWLNLPVHTDLKKNRAFGANVGGLVHTVKAYLLFGMADEKFNFTARNAWPQLVQDVFDGDRTGLGGACVEIDLDAVDYTAVSFRGGPEYLALEFTFTVLAQRD